MNPAGLIFDDSPHYLDHLGPFCALMGWPLVICEPELAERASRFYPDLQVVEENLFHLSPRSHWVSCHPRPLLEAVFPYQKLPPLFWLPHGNSDKNPFVGFFQEQDIALVYGPKMATLMRSQGALCQMIPVGNFRAAYWEKQHSFYQRLLREAIISQLPKKQPCLLYAPTWEDADGSGSFWQAFPTLASHLPDSLNLLVQLHPNTRKRFAIELEGLMGRYEQKKNILFLEPFPPIYPLLSLCTAYIGDLSSIGYDFLKMDKPLFFLNPNQRTGLPLFACGMEVSPETIFKQIEKVDLFSPIRKKTYADTFAPLPDFQTLKAALIR